MSPEFRRYILDRPDALFEKCIIYDGGARRYEIPVHFREVLDYWEGILERAERIDPFALACEKLGYGGPLGYGEWLAVTSFESIPQKGLREIWEAEQALVRRSSGISIKELAERRINEISNVSKLYE